MAETKAQEKEVPPYVSYRTFRNFVDGLRDSLPEVIDRSVMSNLSGAAQAQLLSALRYLGLIDENGVTQDVFTRLVESQGDDRKNVLQEILKEAYSFFFKGFDLTKATGKTFSDKFKSSVGASGETIRKCEVFFLRAAEDAGITISKHIKIPHERSEGRPSRSRVRKQGGVIDNGDISDDDQLPPTPPQVTYEQMLVDKLLSKFPDFDPSWTDEAKASWHENFRELMKMVRESGANEGG